MHFCKHEYDYTYHTYGHLGGFVCNNCGYKRPQPDFAVESVEEMKNDHSVVVANLNGDRNIIKVNIGGAYNIYNAIGCAAALTALGIEQKLLLTLLKTLTVHSAEWNILKPEITRLILFLLKIRQASAKQ